MLTSPIDGTVQEKKISVGDLAQTGTPAFLLTDTRDLFLTVAVPELYVPQIATGKIFEGTTATIPPTRVTAKIRDINPIIDTTTRTLSAKAAVISGSPILRPGMFVKILFKSGKSSRDMLIPQAGILTQAGVSHVFVLHRQGKKWVVKDQTVTLGDPVGDWIEVTGDIKPEERVAASDVAALKEGLVVELGKELSPPENL